MSAVAGSKIKINRNELKTNRSYNGVGFLVADYGVTKEVKRIVFVGSAIY